MKRRPIPSTRLSLERLESRDTPAGVVIVSFLNNAMSFIGDNDAAGNQVQVTAIANDEFLIEGQNGTTFLLGGKNVGNQIDTGNLPAGIAFNFLNDGKTKIKVDLKGGPDRFEYDGVMNGFVARKFGDITVNTGRGSDTTILRQFSGLNVVVDSAPPSVLLPEPDNDVVTVLAGGKFDFNGDTVPEDYGGGIRGNFTCGCYNGADVFNGTVRVTGGIAVNLTDGQDQINLSSSQVGGHVKVFSGALNASISSFFAFPGCSIGGDLVVNAPNTPVDVDIDNSSIGGNVSLTGTSLAGKSSTFDINNCTISGNTVFTSGGGADNFTVTDSSIGRNFTAKMGNGGCITGDKITRTTIGGNLYNSTGQLVGFDSITIEQSTICGNAVISQGADLDTVFLDTSVIGRDFSLYSGTGGTGGVGNPNRLENSRIGGNIRCWYDPVGVARLRLLNIICGGYADFRFANQGFLQLDFCSCYSFGMTGVGVQSQSISLNYVKILNNVLINTGAGNDTVSVGGDSRLGKTTINTGAGNDTISGNCGTNERIVFSRGLYVNGGADNDTTFYGTTPGTVDVFVIMSVSNVETQNNGGNLNVQ